VKFGESNPTQVSLNGLGNVDDFLKACKRELPEDLGQYGINKLSLYLNETMKEQLEVDLDLSVIYTGDEQNQVNSAENPLIIKVESSIEVDHDGKFLKQEK
jgi:hypothetical protein